MHKETKMNGLSNEEVASLRIWAMKIVRNGWDNAGPEMAAKFLGISQQTLERLRKTGEGPSFKLLEGKIVYDCPGLVAYRDAAKRRSRKSD